LIVKLIVHYLRVLIAVILNKRRKKIGRPKPRIWSKTTPKLSLAIFTKIGNRGCDFSNF